MACDTFVGDWRNSVVYMVDRFRGNAGNFKHTRYIGKSGSLQHEQPSRESTEEVLVRTEEGPGRQLI
jgi:hypothetical protein